MKSYQLSINKNLILQTPDGIVKKQHWEVVIKEDSKRQIKALPRLNNSHLQPKQYEKMNTAKAYQVLMNNLLLGQNENWLV